MSRTIAIEYEFKFPDQRQRKFVVELDFETLALVNRPAEPLPDWTLLAFHKCSTCPLNSTDSPRCPAAVSMIDLLDFCGNMVSYEEVDVTVTTEARTYSRHTTMEEAVGSLLGLYMTSSGCPIASQLRPLVEMHLPFVTPTEATYRLTSMYLMGKFFQQKRDKTVDWSLDGLVAILKEVQEVNTDFFKRLNTLSKKDAGRNAVVIMNNLAFLASRSITLDKMKRLEGIFAAAMPAAAQLDPGAERRI